MWRIAERSRLIFLIGLVVSGGMEARAGETVYVANLWSSSVSVVDTDTNRVVDSIQLSNCDGPPPDPTHNCATGSVAISPDGSRLYVTLGYPKDLSSGALAIVDAGSGREVSRIPVGHNPNRVVVTPNGNTVCVVNINDGSLSILDAVESQVVHTVAVGLEPLAVAVSPDSSVAYVADNGSSRITRVDLASGTVTGLLDVGANPSGNYPAALAITPDGNRMYVANGGSGLILVVNLETGDIESTLVADGVDPFPTVFGVLADGSRAYTINGKPAQLYEIDISTNAMKRSGLGLTGISGMALSGLHRRAYLSNVRRDVVYSIDLESFRIIAEIPVGHTPTSLALGSSSANPRTAVVSTIPGPVAGDKVGGGCNIVKCQGIDDLLWLLPMLAVCIVISARWASAVLSVARR